MEYRELSRLLKEGNCPSLLLFEGEEEQLKRKALQELRAKILPEGMEELNETVMDAPETDALIAAAETLPFLSEKRLVIIRDHPALTGRAEADEDLIDYLKRSSPSTVLLFYCSQKPDKRKKLFTTVQKAGGVVSFLPLKDRALTTFVTESFRELQRECDERTAEYLIFTCGTDTSLLKAEIAKIAAHGAPGSPVHPDEVTTLATPSTECTVFQMVDAVVSGQNARAFTLFRNQLQAGTDRVFILAMLLRQFRLMQHIKIMQFEKQSPAKIRSALGVPPFAADQHMRQAAAYSGGEVKRAVQLCLDTETGIKTGQLNAEGAVEAVLLKLLNIHAK